jgi:hypothetical protein
MDFRQPASRWAAWAFAFALLLKAAVPMLASAAAQAQGKALVEVCTVYGVATVGIDGPGTRPAPDHVGAHGQDHCALTALLALTALEPQALALPPETARRPVLGVPHCSPMAHDACATWVARRKHGPPRSA